MSIVKELKNAETKIAALQNELAEAQGAVAAVVAEKDLAIEALNAEIDGIKKQAVELSEAKAAVEAVVAERDTQVTALEAEKADISAQVEKLQKAIESNPAFAAAAAPGNAPVNDGGQAGSDAPKTQAEWLKEYAKIEDPKQQAAFRKEHFAELGLS
jgi:chromosome segregation ATPase